jgi:ribosomal-protein-serine acetyltransferase
MLTFKIDEDLVLRSLQVDDAPPLFLLVEENRAYLREWLPWVDAQTSVEDSRTFILTTQQQHASNLGFQTGIWFRGQLAGVIGFHAIDWANKSVELGYWIGSAYQGYGIVTKACRCLVDHAFDEFQLNRVQIRCATENKKSCAIIERLGFNQEGLIHQAEFLYDHYVDLYVYGMTADEWKTRRGAASRPDEPAAGRTA